MNDTWLLILVGVVLFYLATQKKKPVAPAAPTEPPAPPRPRTVIEEMERVAAQGDGYGYFSNDGLTDY